MVRPWRNCVRWPRFLRRFRCLRPTGAFGESLEGDLAWQRVALFLLERRGPDKDSVKIWLMHGVRLISRSDGSRERIDQRVAPHVSIQQFPADPRIGGVE